MPSALPLVNKAELADVLGVSLPTISALIRRYPDLPIVRRGTNGEAWQFDPLAVRTFIAAQKAEEARSEAARSELLAQFSLPIDDITPDSDKRLAPEQRAKLAEARLKEHRLARESGLLVPTTEVRQALTTAFARLNKDFTAFLRGLAREHSWPEPILRRHEAELADAQRRFVAQAADYLTDHPDDVQQRRLS
jgi:phage terminase Nu1 subunit (DNA packaging protein)